MTAGRVLLHRRGPALWPEWQGLAELEQAHRDVGTPVWRTMYQAEKGGLQGEIVDRSYFRYGLSPAQEGDERRRVLTFMTVDPAIGKTAQSDETAIVVGDVLATPPKTIDEPWIWIRFVHARRGMREREKREAILKTWRYYRPVQIGIESVAYQVSLTELMLDDYPELPVVPVYPDRDKFSRFLTLGALYEFGRIVHHPSLKATRFEDQLVHLPHGRHDDMADGVAYIAEMGGFARAISTGNRPAGLP